MDANFEFHEKWKNPETGRYKTHVYLMDGKQMTGVTTVLGVIAKPALIQWAADMAVKYLSEIDHGTIQDATLQEWQEMLESSRTAHCKKKEAGGDIGTIAHSLIENFIKKVHLEKSPYEEYVHCEQVITDKLTKEEYGQVKPMVEKFVKWSIDNDVVFLDSEKKVYSKEWFVAGTFDFSFEKDGKRFIGDLKTMGKIWDRVPFFQTAAYRKMSMEMGEEHYDGSCIVNISKPSEKYPSMLSTEWSYDFDNDQKAFEAALTLYRQLNNF